MGGGGASKNAVLVSCQTSTPVIVCVCVGGGGASKNAVLIIEGVCNYKFD